MAIVLHFVIEVIFMIFFFCILVTLVVISLLCCHWKYFGISVGFFFKALFYVFRGFPFDVSCL